MTPGTGERLHCPHWYNTCDHGIVGLHRVFPVGQKPAAIVVCDEVIESFQGWPPIAMNLVLNLTTE